MPSVQQRVKDIREELQSRLDITEEQLKGLAAYAGQKVGHQTGDWVGGRSVPGEGNEGMIIVAMFDNAPDGYDVDEQGDEYTFGECRAYVLATSDILGPMKDNLIAAGDEMFCVVYRLFASGQPIRKVMDEETFVSALCTEFEALAAMAGLDTADDTWTCGSCKKINPDTLERDGADEDEEEQKASFCAGCGTTRVELVS